MAHTPGSWTLDYYGDREIDVYSGDVLVCAMRGGCTDPDDEEAATADAHLIAAAPELLEALTAAHAAITYMMSNDDCGGAPNALEQVAAAITKAEGRTA